MRPVPGASRREVRAALQEREQVLKPAIRQMLDAINAVVPTEHLAQAPVGDTTRLFEQAARKIHDVAILWERALAELLISPGRGLRKSFWDDLPLQLLRTIAMNQIGDLIRELTQEQLATVRLQLAAVIRHGATPDVLRALGETTGLTARQHQAIQNTYEQVLAQSGRAEAVAAAERQRRRLLDYRSTLIARTESTRYLGAVVQTRGEQLGEHTVKAWVSARDGDVDGGDRLGPCAIADNGEWIPVGERFANGLSGPPAHPGCRCVLEISVEPMSASVAA